MYTSVLLGYFRIVAPYNILAQPDYDNCWSLILSQTMANMKYLLPCNQIVVQKCQHSL